MAPLPVKPSHRTALLVTVIVAVTAAIELAMGRLPLGPDGRFGWWESNIWSSEQSQRVADAYSFSHVIHGMLFYALLRWIAPRLPLRVRLLLAVLIEAGWELAENSPLIIDRYRAVTIALGYEGDSVLNSSSDVLMMMLGFWLAGSLRPWVTTTLAVASELAMLVLVRDNLTLNIIMLVYPIDAIRVWQMAGAPH
jgi:hypothetical protein